MPNPPRAEDFEYDETWNPSGFRVDPQTGEVIGTTSAGGGGSDRERHPSIEVGLKAEDVQGGRVEEGQFYALLKPMLALVQARKAEGICEFRVWDRSENTCFTVPENTRFLWYQGELELEGSLAKNVGPGTIFIHRPTNRLFFIGPEAREKQRVQVLADWDVKLNLGETLWAREVSLYYNPKIDWGPKQASRFDLIG